jgi:hypothetical protein
LAVAVDFAAGFAAGAAVGFAAGVAVGFAGALAPSVDAKPVTSWASFLTCFLSFAIFALFPNSESPSLRQ